MRFANNNGYTIIRIFQEDIWHDKNDWLNKLKSCLYIHNVPEIIYLSSGDNYINYK